MKILKKHTLKKPEWECKAQCEVCKTELLVDVSDLTLETTRTLPCENHVWFECPVCNSKINLYGGSLWSSEPIVGIIREYYAWKKLYVKD